MAQRGRQKSGLCSEHGLEISTRRAQRRSLAEQCKTLRRQRKPNHGPRAGAPRRDRRARRLSTLGLREPRALPIYELRLSEDEAQRRCRAARVARQFPILFEMLADAEIAPRADVPALIEPIGPAPDGFRVPAPSSWSSFVHAVAGYVRELAPGDELAQAPSAPPGWREATLGKKRGEPPSGSASAAPARK